MPNVQKRVCVKLWKYFPYVLFEMERKDGKIEISTNDEFYEEAFMKIVLGSYRLQYLNLPGTDYLWLA